MEAGDGQRARGRRGKHRDAADNDQPCDPAREGRPPDAAGRGDGPTKQVVGQREDSAERSVRRVRPPIAADFAEEHRLAAHDAAVDDDRLANGERLRDRKIAGVGQVFGLKVHLEFVRSAKDVARGRERVKRLEECEEQRGLAGRSLTTRATCCDHRHSALAYTHVRIEAAEAAPLSRDAARCLGEPRRIGICVADPARRCVRRLRAWFVGAVGLDAGRHASLHGPSRTAAAQHRSGARPRIARGRRHTRTADLGRTARDGAASAPDDSAPR